MGDLLERPSFSTTSIFRHNGSPHVKHEAFGAPSRCIFATKRWRGNFVLDHFHCHDRSDSVLFRRGSYGEGSLENKLTCWCIGDSSSWRALHVHARILGAGAFISHSVSLC